MKTLIVTICLLVAVQAQNKYEAINENFDISEVLGNERLLNSYSRCLLNKGPCTPEVKQLKEKLPEVLETNCAKCTEKQKQTGKQLALEIMKSHPEIWKQLVKTYDPNGKYQKQFEEFLKS